MSNEGWYRWKGDSRLDWTWHGFDLVATAHYIDGFKERLVGTLHRPHYVSQTWTFDVQASYNLVFAPPVEAKPVAGYSKSGKDVTTSKDGKTVESTSAYEMPCWKSLLNNTTFTIGCNNVFGQDPPFASGEAGNSVGYPGYTYDATGRFVYLRLTKKF
jgi:outer membrane receptor protein involved in Fe transport